MLILLSSFWGQEDFEDTKGVIRNRKLKEEQTTQKPIIEKRQTTIYKTLHIKLKIE